MKCIITNVYAELRGDREATISRLTEKQCVALSTEFDSMKEAQAVRKSCGLYNEGWQVADLKTFPTAVPYLKKQTAGAPVGNHNAAKLKEDKRTSRIVVHVTPSEKAGCVKQAPRNLNAWCRAKLGLNE